LPETDPADWPTKKLARFAVGLIDRLGGVGR
jgi:hypothetical protein